MKLKTKDLFDIEATILQGCQTKHWQLLKALNKVLVKCREYTEVARAALEPSAAYKAWQAAVAEVRNTNQHEKPEIIEEKVRAVNAEHPDGQRDLAANQKLNRDIADDDVDVVWEQIPENLFHDGGMCRVDGPAYMLLSRFGIVQHE